MAGIVIEATTVAGAKTFLLQLTKTIFLARDFSLVDKEIATAVKIMVGLQALTLDSPQSITNASRQQIVMTLNNICGLYSPQMDGNF